MLVDKTGTVTLGLPEVEQIIPADGRAADDVLRLAASLDQMSAHSLATSLVREARRRGLMLEMPELIQEGVGQGISGLVAGLPVLVGSVAFARRSGVRGIDAAAPVPADSGRARIVVAVDGRLAGTVVMADHLREGAAQAITDLRRAGIRHIAIVSGDSAAVTEQIGGRLGVDAVYSQQTPQDKLAVCAALQSDPRLRAVAMVGDGINDAPALAAADVGIALGTGGGTAAAEAADVVIVDARLDRVAEAVRIGRRSMAIARQSVLVGIGLSVLGMAVAASGHLTPVQGALGQEAIDVSVILNALRALRAPGDDAAPAPVHD
jgi:cation transport ATPase